MSRERTDKACTLEKHKAIYLPRNLVKIRHNSYSSNRKLLWCPVSPSLHPDYFGMQAGTLSPRQTCKSRVRQSFFMSYCNFTDTLFPKPGVKNNDL